MWNLTYPFNLSTNSSKFLAILELKLDTLGSPYKPISIYILSTDACECTRPWPGFKTVGHTQIG